mgnify:CR=1 FL=1
MRNKGSITIALCWKLEVINQNEIIFTKEYTTLKEIANELGMTYNQVVEMSSGRKKPLMGRFDTTYKFIKISGKSECKEDIKDLDKVVAQSEED